MKKISTSKRLDTVPTSPIRKLMPYALEAKKKGIKIYHLNIGDPDIKTPEVMLGVLKNWQNNPIPYSPSKGDPNFIEAIRRYYKQLGINFLKPEHIQITLGGSEAISMAIFATCEEGDEILVFEPFYTNYISLAAVNGVKLTSVTTRAADNFHLPPASEIENKITNKTKAILITNPSNPTGTVYAEKEIRMLISIAKKHNLFLLSDEVYREFTYDGKKHYSILDVMEKIPDKAILLDSLSKRYSLCGARLGVVISLNPEIINGVSRIAQGRLSAGMIDQYMAAKLSEVKPQYFLSVKREYESRRNVLYEGLKNIPDITVFKPEGAFYLIVGLPVKNSEDFCRWLLTDFNLNKETVMLAPAQGFYLTPGLGRNEVRMAYVINSKDLASSAKILKEAIKVYSANEI